MLSRMAIPTAETTTMTKSRDNIKNWEFNVLFFKIFMFFFSRLIFTYTLTTKKLNP